MRFARKARPSKQNKATPIKFAISRQICINSTLLIQPLISGNVSGGSRPGVWWEVKLWGDKKVFTCLCTKGCLRKSLCVTHKRLLFVGQKVAILLVELCDFSGNNHSLKVLYINNSENV